MELLNSILYDTVYHSAPIILCVIGGIFAYKANVLNIALEGMMLNGAFISVLVVTIAAITDRKCGSGSDCRNRNDFIVGTCIFILRNYL